MSRTGASGVRRAAAVVAALGASIGGLGLSFLVQSAAPAGASALGSWSAYVADESAVAAWQIENVNTASPSVNASSITVGTAPFGVAISPNGSTAYVSNQSGHSISVITTSTNTVAKTITGFGKPEGLAVSPDGTELWFADYTNNDVYVVCVASAGCGSTAQYGTVSTIPTGPATHPFSIAISPDGDYVYFGDYSANTVGELCNIAADCGSTAQYGEITTLTVAKPVFDIGFTPDGNYGFADSDAAAGDVVQIGTPQSTTPTVANTLPMGSSLQGLAVLPDCTSASCDVYAANTDGDLSEITGADSATPVSVPAAVTGFDDPYWIAPTPDSGTLYVTDVSDAVVYTVSTSGNDITDASSPLGSGEFSTPEGIAITPDPAPTAAFTDTPEPEDLATTFNASTSSDPVSGITIASYAWNFGDGCTYTTSSDTVSFVYDPNSGDSCSQDNSSLTGISGTVAATESPTVSLTVTDSAGTSTTEVFTGQTVSNDGGPSATTSAAISIPAPVVTQVAITSTAVSFTAGPSATHKITATIENSSGHATDLPSGVSLTVEFSTTSPLTNGGGFAATSGGSATATLGVVVASGADTGSAYYGDTVSGWPIVSAQAEDSGLTTGTQVETVSAGAVVAADSAAAALPVSQSADGVGTSTVTITLKDQYGNGVPGKTVTLSQGATTHATITTVDGTSNQDGVALFTVKDSTSEATVFTGKDTTDSITVTQTAGVDFVSDLPDVLAVLPPSGSTAGGTATEICGTNLGTTGSPPTSVDFGANAATGVSVNATMDAQCPAGSTTSVSATTPAALSAGTVNVIVDTTVGTSTASVADGFLYAASDDYFAVTPYRVCDTRSGNPADTSGTDAQCNGLTLQAGSGSKTKGIITFQVAGTNPSGSSSGGVPADATAVVANVTVVNQTATSGSLDMWPAGTPTASPASLNWWATGTNVSNQVEVAVGSNGDISLQNNSTGTTDAAVNIEGYVGPGATGNEGQFTPVTEFRLVDTRTGSGDCDAGDGLAAHATLIVQVSGTLSCGTDTDTGVPATGVSAVLLKVAEVSATAGGTLAAYPTGSAGNVNLAGVTNFVSGEVLSNHATVGVGGCTASGCSVSIYNNSTGTTNITVDVQGYYSTSTGTAGTAFTPIYPNTICDTRASNPSGLVSPENQCSNGTTGSTLQSDASENFTCSTTGTSDCETFAATGMEGVPSAAAAVVLDATVVDPTAGGNLIVSSPSNFVEGNPLPTATIAFSAGYTLNLLIVVSPNASGDLEVWNQSSGKTNVVISEVGWYQ